MPLGILSQALSPRTSNCIYCMPAGIPIFVKGKIIYKKPKEKTRTSCGLQKVRIWMKAFTAINYCYA